jgi:mycothiol synthase
MRRAFALGGPAGVTLEEHVRGLKELEDHPEEAAVALEGDAVVGYTHPASVRLEVDPAYRRRGHGLRLLEAARHLAAAAGDDQLELWAPVEGAGRVFAEAMGMRYRSSFHLLRLSPEAVVPEPAPMFGIGVRAIRPGEDDADVVALLNEAFAGHPSPMRFSVERIAEAHARPDFDPADVRLAHEADNPNRLVGFCRAVQNPAPDVPTRGDVRLVGVLPAYRRRGIGRELLRWGIGHVRARGALEVDLVVEALNASALQLYRAEGFAQVAEWPRWVLPTAQAR